MTMHFLVDDYLRGDLDDTQLAAFEERLVWDQSLLDELELAERLKEGLRASQPAMAHQSEAHSTSVSSRLSNWMARPMYAAAASFLLATTLATVFYPAFYNPDLAATSYTTAHTALVPLMTFRNGDPHKISVRDDTTSVLLIDILTEHDSYRAMIRSEPSGDEVWSGDDLRLTDLDRLAISVPGSSLIPGQYTVSVYGVDASGTPSHIQGLRFEVSNQQ
jgi:hypothetical protein